MSDYAGASHDVEEVVTPPLDQEEELSHTSSFSSEHSQGPTCEVCYVLNEDTPVPGCNDGLSKTLLVEGHGPRPVRGAKVLVHYVGTLEGTGEVFDSSRDRGDPFEFTIGRGQVIKGWDKGVATMRIGEKAILKCRADYAYGAAGSPPKIPPNATLLFEVELLSWTREEDVSEKKDGSMMKRTLVEGVDYANPEFEAEVVIDVEIYLGPYAPEDPNEVTPVWEKKGWSFVVGEIPLPPLLEECLKNMRKEESSIFRIASRYIQEAVSEFNVPSAEERENADISYKVKIHELKTATTWGLASAAKITEGNLRVDKGNAAFKAGNTALAERYYRRALEFLGEYFGPEEEGKADWDKARVRAMNNISQVLLLSGNYGEVISTCRKIIDIHPSEKKALFRLAKALNAQQDWEEALATLNKILREDPDNIEVKALRTQVSGEMRAYNEKQKSMFKKMFS